jgi:phage terminase Nu1 subunit (DNA packaging protein)
MRDQYQCHGIARSGKRCQRRCDAKGFCSVHPAEGGLVTKTGLAKMQGVVKGRVSQWLKEGTITETDDGYIEWSTAQKSIAASRDHSRPLTRQGTPHPEALVPGDLPGNDDDEDDYGARFVRARALHEEEKHKLAELKRRKEEGELVNAEEVAMAFANVAAIVQQKLRTIPGRVAARVRACATEAEVRAMLMEEIDIALTALADGLVVDDDDE